MFGLKPPEGYSTYPEYVKRWRGAMTEAYELASTHSLKSGELGKVQYNKRVRHTTLYEGDRVLVRNLLDRGGSGKLHPYWEQEIYVVTEKKGHASVRGQAREWRWKVQSSSPQPLTTMLLLTC